MIVFDLRCKKGHQFEAWFKDSAAYDSQRAERAVACPTCGGRSVEKAPMAPNIAPSRGQRRTKGDGQEDRKGTYYQMVKELHRQVEENCDYVGERFSDEARRMHTGEVEKRGIYGEATLKDALELKEEGIECHPLPELPHTDA